MKLNLAQAQSNRAPHGRKTDIGDAKRLLRRLVAGELFLSFVPDAEQRSWRSVTRARVQLVTERVICWESAGGVSCARWPIREGRGVWSVGGKTFEGRGGDIFVIKAGEIHSLKAIGDSPLVQLHVHLSPHFIQENL